MVREVACFFASIFPFFYAIRWAETFCSACVCICVVLRKRKKNAATRVGFPAGGGDTVSGKKEELEELER